MPLQELRLQELRRHIGFVLQEPYIFDATIEANIALGDVRPDRERVRWAAEVANAAEFIERLPLRYATQVGDSGLRLSGDQALRLAIARVICVLERGCLVESGTHEELMARQGLYAYLVSQQIEG